MKIFYSDDDKNHSTQVTTSRPQRIPRRTVLNHLYPNHHVIPLCHRMRGHPSSGSDLDKYHYTSPRPHTRIRPCIDNTYTVQTPLLFCLPVKFQAPWSFETQNIRTRLTEPWQRLYQVTVRLPQVCFFKKWLFLMSLWYSFKPSSEDIPIIRPRNLNSSVYLWVTK